MYDHSLKEYKKHGYIFKKREANVQCPLFEKVIDEDLCFNINEILDGYLQKNKALISVNWDKAKMTCADCTISLYKRNSLRTEKWSSTKGYPLYYADYHVRPVHCPCCGRRSMFQLEGTKCRLCNWTNIAEDRHNPTTHTAINKLSLNEFWQKGYLERISHEELLRYSSNKPIKPITQKKPQKLWVRIVKAVLWIISHIIMLIIAGFITILVIIMMFALGGTGISWPLVYFYYFL